MFSSTISTKNFCNNKICKLKFFSCKDCRMMFKSICSVNNQKKYEKRLVTLWTYVKSCHMNMYLTLRGPIESCSGLLGICEHIWSWSRQNLNFWRNLYRVESEKASTVLKALHTVNPGSEMWRHYRSLEKIYFGQLW